MSLTIISLSLSHSFTHFFLHTFFFDNFLIKKNNNPFSQGFLSFFSLYTLHLKTIVAIKKAAIYRDITIINLKKKK